MVWMTRFSEWVRDLVDWEDTLGWCFLGTVIFILILHHTIWRLKKMALRYMPAEAEPIRAKVAGLEAELVSKFSSLFSAIGWLEEDRWDLFYRPVYFDKFTKEDRKNCRWVHDQARFGKDHRNFGITYDLYLIQMNNLNFGNALSGPGLTYKDGELAKIYINRIIDSSHDMANELDKLS